MKKDKKWLKEKADRLFFDNSISNNPYLVAKREAITEISNLIDQLDEPEVLSQEWIDEHKWDNDHIWKPFVCIEDLKNLLVPKKELPVIPKFVADYLCRAKTDITLMRVMELANTRNELPKWKNEYDWISENDEEFARAWLDGYEVEKEKKYQVIIRDGEYIRLYLCKHGDNVMIGMNDNYIEKCPEVTYLTEQEIKDYDERYWAFAQEVTE